MFHNRNEKSSKFVMRIERLLSRYDILHIFIKYKLNYSNFIKYLNKENVHEFKKKLGKHSFSFLAKRAEKSKLISFNR